MRLRNAFDIAIIAVEVQCEEESVHLELILDNIRDSMFPKIDSFFHTRR
jgi:hypothetical protein